MTLFSATQLDDKSVLLSGGLVLHGVHESGKCLGSHCPLHNPSNHSLADLPLDFNGVNMVRVTDSGVSIDPDDYNFNESGSAILRNSAFCEECKVEVESKSRHDFATCKCGNISVDGGHSYIRRAVRDPHSYTNTSIVIEKADNS